MAGKSKRYILTKSILTRFMNAEPVRKRRWSEFKCSVCNVLLKVGDDIVSKSSSSQKKPYHRDCYEGLFIH